MFEHDCSFTLRNRSDHSLDLVKRFRPGLTVQFATAASATFAAEAGVASYVPSRAICLPSPIASIRLLAAAFGHEAAWVANSVQPDHEVAKFAGSLLKGTVSPMSLTGKVDLLSLVSHNSCSRNSLFRGRFRGTSAASTAGWFSGRGDLNILFNSVQGSSS